MNQDPQTRSHAASILEGLFRHIGSGGSEPVPQGVNLGGMGQQVEQFVAMPLELAQLFTGMAVDLTNLILDSLEQAGIILAEGLIP